MHVFRQLVVIEAIRGSHRLLQHLASRIGERAPCEAERIYVSGHAAEPKFLIIGLIGGTVMPVRKSDLKFHQIKPDDRFPSEIASRFLEHFIGVDSRQ